MINKNNYFIEGQQTDEIK